MTNENKIRLLSLFHTQLRNVCNFTALSFSLLAISRFYREKLNNIYNISFVFFSLIFLFCSIYIIRTSKHTIQNLKENDNNEDNELINNWIVLYDVFLVINITFILYTLNTAFYQFDNKIENGL